MPFEPVEGWLRSGSDTRRPNIADDTLRERTVCFSVLAQLRHAGTGSWKNRRRLQGAAQWFAGSHIWVGR